MSEFILLGTPACHLCEQAEALLEQYQLKKPRLTIKKIDIAEHSVWQERYAVRIPVLHHADTGNDLNWPFDSADIETFFANIATMTRE